MKKIRRNIFETNSSSSHSLVMCLEEDYAAWEKGNVYLCIRSILKNKNYELYHFYSTSEIDNLFGTDVDERKKYFVSKEEYCSFDHTSLSYFKDIFVTPKDEIVVSFGIYGRED